jgi:RNA polymerase sigma-70 factor, ECF subfamily
VNDSLGELVVRCQRGDKAAVAQLIAETHEGIYHLAYSILRNREEAEDMTQEVYVRAWRALPTFRSDARLSTWLYRIAVNTCLNRCRHLRSQLSRVDGEEALQNLAAPTADPLDVALRNERNASLWAAVDRLPEKYRLIINLFYQREMSYQEVAHVLSLPLGTVKAHLNRARAALARILVPQTQA